MGRLCHGCWGNGRSCYRTPNGAYSPSQAGAELREHIATVRQTVRCPSTGVQIHAECCLLACRHRLIVFSRAFDRRSTRVGCVTYSVVSRRIYLLAAAAAAASPASNHVRARQPRPALPRVLNQTYLCRATAPVLAIVGRKVARSRPGRLGTSV